MQKYAKGQILYVLRRAGGERASAGGNAGDGDGNDGGRGGRRSAGEAGEAAQADGRRSSAGGAARRR